MPPPGGVPEWPKGTGCKPVGSAYGGSNPPAPTPAKDSNTLAALSGASMASPLSFAATSLHESERTRSIAVSLSNFRR
jgi:hypothetical protein